MQLFITHPQIRKCTKFLDTRRLIKACLETAQLLSTSLHVHTGSGPLKVSHLNHPIAKWVRTNRSTYLWTLNYFKSILNEFERRRGKRHKYDELVPVFELGINKIASGRFPGFCNCAANLDRGLDFRHLEVHKAYRLYLRCRWKSDTIKPSHIK